MARKQKPFACPKCGNVERFTWKTRAGKPMEVLTTYAWITLRQMQVQCSSSDVMVWMILKGGVLNEVNH